MRAERDIINRKRLRKERELERKRKKQRSYLKKTIILLSFLFIVFIALLFFFAKEYSIKEMVIEGNEFYKEQEIKREILQKQYNKNTIILYIRNKLGILDKELTLVKNIVVRIENKNKVTIKIEENKPTYLLKHNNEYIYLNKEGVYLTKDSKEYEEGIIIILSNYKIKDQYKSIIVDDEEIFNIFSRGIGVLKEQDINIYSIEKTKGESIIIDTGTIKIKSIDMKNLDEKLKDIKDIVKECEGKTGIIYITEDSNNEYKYTFHSTL